MTSKNPDIRFKGFSEAWEQRKLVDTLKVNSGKDYKHLKNGPIPVYGTGGYMLSVDDKLSEQDSIGIGRKGTIDKPQYLKAPFWTVDTLFFMTPFKQYNINFLYSMTQKINWKKLDESTGVPSLSKINIEKINQFFPAYEEQTQIGTFFLKLDKTIALHQHELTILKQRKKAFLQKMFPKKGKYVPEIRFNGFTNNWEQKNFREILTSAYQGINTAGDKVDYDEKGIEILQSKHITSGSITFNGARKINKNKYKEYFPKYVPNKGDILFANIGTIGPSTVVNTEKEFLIAWNILKIKLNSNYNENFIQLYLQILNINHFFESITTGNATKFINKDEILNIKIFTPVVKEEQIKIGNFFSQLDESITLQEQKLESLKQMKKGFLQKMFV